MKKEDLLNDDFLKQFKSGEELTGFLKQLQKRGIEEQIREIYNFDVSTSNISRITDSITNDIVAWQNRPLEPVYLIVWIF